MPGRSLKEESLEMNTQPNKIATPLSRKAVLVSVNVSQWTARRLDRKVTDEVNRQHNAAKDAGRYNKLLIEADKLADINKLVSSIRQLHYSMTRPWCDEGPRILPNVLYSKFTDALRVMKRDYETAVDKFCRGYPDYVETRAKQLNGLFRAEDYPSASEIRSKFSVEMKVLPFPNAEDFRSDLDDDTVADIKREISEMSSKVADDAMKHTINQIIELVGHMAGKLHEYKSGENKPKKKGEKTERSFFMDSLVDNVRDLAELLPAFNLTDDPKLTAITRRIAKELCVEDAKELRKNEAAREAVAKSADEIVAEVSKFLA
jgi:hypothetical protein